LSKSQSIVAGLGAALIALNILAVPLWMFPVPVKLSNGMQNLSKNVASAPEYIKIAAGMAGVQEDDFIRSLLRELKISWFKSFAFSGFSILVGVLLIKHIRLGRYLALGLLGWIIAYRVMLIFNRGINEYISVYSFILKRFPILTILDHINFSLALVGFVILVTPWGGAAFREVD